MLDKYGEVLDLTVEGDTEYVEHTRQLQYHLYIHTDVNGMPFW